MRLKRTQGELPTAPMTRPQVIRLTAFVALAAGLAWAGFRLAGPEDRRLSADAINGTKSWVPPASTLTDADEVFKSAMWRRPSPEDNILHAERREWRDANGVSRWQWFLEVHPSAELVKHLREDNAFGLVPGKQEPRPDHAPEWYDPKAGDFDTMTSAMTGMSLMFNKNRNLLYATAAGGGFRPGAPEPLAPPPQPQVATGRFPLNPPPNPNNP